MFQFLRIPRFLAFLGRSHLENLVDLLNFAFGSLCLSQPSLPLIALSSFQNNLLHILVFDLLNVDIAVHLNLRLVKRRVFALFFRHGGLQRLLDGPSFPLRGKSSWFGVVLLQLLVRSCTAAALIHLVAHFINYISALIYL